jgi:hypothetical protein
LPAAGAKKEAAPLTGRGFAISRINTYQAVTKAQTSATSAQMNITIRRRISRSGLTQLSFRRNNVVPSDSGWGPSLIDSH